MRNVRSNGTHRMERSKSEAQRSDNVIERSERTRFGKERQSCSLNEVKTKRRERMDKGKMICSEIIFFSGNKAK